MRWSSIEELQKAASVGNPEACNQLGIEYCKGQLVKQDYLMGKTWYENAISLGCTDAEFNLGYLYMFGLGVSEDLGQAVYWYEQASDHGSAEAKNMLSDMYMDGYGVVKDTNKGISLLMEAAWLGWPEAMLGVGMLYYEGRLVPQDYAEAKSWYEAAANAGNQKAMHNLAVMYMQGEGVQKDEEAYKEWRKKAACAGFELDMAVLLQELAWRLSEKEAEKARIIFLHSKREFELISQGASAQEAAHMVDQEMPCVPEIRTEEVEEFKSWINKGLENHSPYAVFTFGRELINGKYYPQNVEEGLKRIKWFVDSDSQFYYQGLEDLAQIYSEGKVVPVDPELALQYAQQYCDAGRDDGLELMDTVKKNLDSYD